MIAAFLLLGLACETPLPGEVEAGLFDFFVSAALEENCKPYVAEEESLEEESCKPNAAENSLGEFEGRFRLKSDLVDGYFVYRSTHRSVQFDGQNMRSVYEFSNRGENCELQVVETLEVALLSETQDEVFKGQCPCSASGESIPVDEAEGIFPPRPVPGGFDAVRACGTLMAQVRATPLTAQGCTENCPEEKAVYYIEGVRRE